MSQFLRIFSYFQLSFSSFWGLILGTFYFILPVYAQNSLTFEPIDYWTFNDSDSRNKNVSTKTLNGGSLDVCYDCNTGYRNYSPTTPPPVWTNMISGATVNTGQLQFPMNSQDSLIHPYDTKVFAVKSQTKRFNADNNPWCGAKNGTLVREASLEFLMKPAGLQRGLIIHTAFGQFIWQHNGFEAILRLNGGVGYPTTLCYLPFDNINRLSPSYYAPSSPSNVNSNWHHIVITVKTYDLTLTPPSDKKPGLVASICFWVDGQKVGEKSVYSKIVSNGTFAGSASIVSADCSIAIGESNDPENKIPISNTYPRAYYFEGLLDEIALYNRVIPPTLIYQHYTETLNENSLKGEGKYSFTIKNPKAEVPLTFKPSTTFDPKESLPLEVNEANTIAKQFANIPLPRYKPGHQLLRNVNMTLSFLNTDKYMLSQGKTYSSKENIGMLNWELARNWHYYLSANLLWGPSDIGNIYRTQANAPENADLPLAYTFFVPLYPNTDPSPCRIKFDAKDKKSFFTDEKGNIINTQYKPGGSTADFEKLGQKVKQMMEGYWAGQKWDDKTCSYISSKEDIPFNRPFALLVDDDEHPNLIPISTYYNRNEGLKKLKSDPIVWKHFNNWMEKQNPGNRSVYHYESENRLMLHKGLYRDVFMSTLKSNGAISANTKFMPYRWANYWEYEGSRHYQLKHNEEYYASNSNYANDPTGIEKGLVRPREIVAEITKPTIKDKHFSQSYAFSGYGNDKGGWNWNVIESHEEILEQDKRSTRPAEALGFTKYMAILGTEFHQLYYGRCGCYSNAVNHCADNPNAILWQYIVPSYTQAITSRYEEIFKKGEAMLGDIGYPTTGYGATQIAKEFKDTDPLSPIIPNDNHTKYTFNTHDNRIVVGARKYENKYAIATTILNFGNEVKKDEKGHIIERNTPLEATTQFELEKGLYLKIKTRRQGSVYIFDRSEPNKPIFYQLDAWHQVEHPYYWSKNFFFEAELYDNPSLISGSQTFSPYTIISYLKPPVIENGMKTYDMTDAFSGISFVTNNNAKPNTNAVEYQFQPRSETKGEIMRYSIRIKIMNNNPKDLIGLEFYLDDNPSKVASTSKLATNQSFEWINVEGMISVTANQTHTLKIKPSVSDINILNKLVIDAIELSVKQ